MVLKSWKHSLRCYNDFIPHSDLNVCDFFSLSNHKTEQVFNTLRSCLVKNCKVAWQKNMPFLFPWLSRWPKLVPFYNGIVPQKWCTPKGADFLHICGLGVQGDPTQFICLALDRKVYVGLRLRSCERPREQGASPEQRSNCVETLKGDAETHM